MQPRAHELWPGSEVADASLDANDDLGRRVSEAAGHLGALGAATNASFKSL